MKKQLFTAIFAVAAATALGQVTDTGSNVGIGNAAPTSKLDVNGSVNLSAGSQLTIGGVRSLATNGTQNIFMGHQSGVVVTTGQRNTLIGHQAGRVLTTGSNNTFFGYRTGYGNTTGDDNVFMGNTAGFTNTTGFGNMFIGYRAGFYNTTGISNMFLGYSAGQGNTTGASNVAIGKNAGFVSTTGSDNAYIGRDAGSNSTTGSSNTFVGRSAGLSNTTGGSNTYIGSGADGSATLTGSTAIGYNAVVTQNNSVVIGSSITNMGVGLSAPTQKLHVEGSARITGAILDSNNEPGTAGQVLSSTVTGTDWVAGTAGPTGPTGAAGAAGADGLSGLNGSNGAIGPTGATGPLVAGTTGQTLRNNGATWVASSTIYNDETNVGIGSTSPSQKLHVSGNARLTGAFYDSNNSPGTTDYVLTSSVTGTEWRDVCDIVAECTNLAATVGWGEDSVAISSESGFQTRMFMDNPGQLLGIGTLEPTSKVDIRTNGLVAGGTMQAVLNIALTVPPGQTSNVRSAKFTGGNGVEIGNGLLTDRMRITQGAQNGHVLMSNSNGDASWSDPVASGISGGWGFNNTLVQMLPPPPDSLENQDPPSTITVAAVQSFAGETTPFIFGSNGIGYDSSATENATRMTYMPSRAAFRAGYDDQNGWNFNNQGVGSSAFGWNTEASGDYSHASGQETEATGDYSFAHGNNCIASGGNSIAFGSYSTASSASFAAGSNCTASGYGSIAFGNSSEASSSYTVAMGYNSSASGLYSNAFGYNSTASGARSLSAGFYNTAQSYGETAFGLYGLVGAGNATSFVATDRLFSIGNGTTNTARSNAMTILKNGNMGIGTTTPNALLQVGTTTGARIRMGSGESIEDAGGSLIGVLGNFAPLTNSANSLGTSSLRWSAVYATSGTVSTSDLREKKNVKDINYGIETIKKLRPVEYQWISGNDDNKKLGLIAQELQKVIPEVVVSKEFVITNEETNEGEWKEANRLGVYYSDLIPVLIKGIQEQQTQIEELQPAKVSALEEKVAKLESENLSMKQQLEEILSRLNGFDGDLQNCCFNAGQGSGISSNYADEQLAKPILEQNIPNPFRENTTIKYYLPSDSRIASITISDLNGVQLKQFDLQGKGFGQVLISGGSFAAGTYVYTLTVNGKQVDSKKMMLL